MPKFALGQVVATPGALAAFERNSTERPVLTSQSMMAEYLVRHGNGDWGDLIESDRDTQDASLARGAQGPEAERLMSCYTLGDGTKIWIITEWDRSVTTILLPDEY